MRPDIIKNANTVEVISYGKTLVIEGHDITHLEGEGNYTFVHTQQGKKYLVSKTMKTLQANLSDGFIRVHKSFAINADHLISWVEPSYLLLSSGARLPVARRRTRKIVEKLAIVSQGVW